MKFNDLIGVIARNAKLENEFINLLSFLEYIGCRKIVKGVNYLEVSLDTLTHIHEESLHAMMLKHLVPESCSWGDLEMGQIGWVYFQELDRRISAVVTPSYREVSFAIESRVLEVYPALIGATGRQDVRRTLEAILLQERRHAGMFATDGFERWCEIERELWGVFVMGLERIVTDFDSRPKSVAVKKRCTEGPDLRP